MGGVSTYDNFGVPPSVAVTLFTVALIVSLIQTFSGADLGIFKIPSLAPKLRRPFRIWGPVLLILTLAAFLPLWSKPQYLEPQKARWGPVDGAPAGIFVIQGQDSTKAKAFIPWNMLEPEIEKKLFPQVTQIPRGSRAEVFSFEGKDNWLVEAIGPNRSFVAYIWFGPDPTNGWMFDGLIRAGLTSPDGSHTVVWQTFQRYSDGSYLRQK